MKMNIVKLGGYAMVTKSIIDRVNAMRSSQRRAIRRTRVANLAVGVSVGSAVGVAAGMLFAPRSGKETRDRISQRTEETWDSVRSNVSDAKNRAADTIKHKSEKLHEAAETCAEAVGEAIGSDKQSDDKGKKNSKK